MQVLSKLKKSFKSSEVYKIIHFCRKCRISPQWCFPLKESSRITKLVLTFLVSLLRNGLHEVKQREGLIRSTLKKKESYNVYQTLISLRLL